MASKQTSSMSSVWDTLNAMKARQANAAVTVNKHRVVDAARREAVSAFERAVAEGDRDVWRHIANDKAVRTVVNAHKERVRGRESAELAQLKQMSEVARDQLAVVADAVGRANRALKIAEGR